MKNARPILAFAAPALFALLGGIPLSARNAPSATGAASPSGAPMQMVITVLSAKGGAPPEQITPSDLSIVQGKTPLSITSIEHLAGDNGAMQLLILLDDSTVSSSLSLHFGELRTFLNALPPTIQVAVGYMRSGAGPVVQPFTTDHQAAASSLRLPLASPGANGSPYFALSEFLEHWPAAGAGPAQEPTPRRAVLMLTDGVDRYFGTSEIDDPYADAAIRNAQKQGVQVYSIYLRDSGAYDRSSSVTLFAQSRLDQLAHDTGGYAYFQDFANPVTIAPFLYDLAERLDNQYRLTLAGVNGKGLLEVKVRTALPAIKITAPSRVLVP